MKTQKNILLIFLAMVMVSPSFAQNKPNGGSRGAATSTTIDIPSVTIAATDKVSYVRTFDFYKAMTSDANIATEITGGNVMQTTQYVDGLGRPIQTVARRALPSGSGYADMVQFMLYDEYGRQVYQPMAYRSTASSGHLELSPSASQGIFLASHYPDEDVFYGRTEYEDSPLNRVTKQMAPGNSWTGSDNGVANSWRSNNNTDAVRSWTVGSGTPTSTAYAADELMVTITTDEEGHQVKEFTDKLGRTVLKQVQDTGTADGHAGWLNTYYLYDDFGNLRYVLPPKLVDIMRQSSWAWVSDDINNLAFQYTYDDRNRMVTKRVPGAGEVHMVYDKLDRLVLTQDANQRSINQWAFTKYDALNRPVMTGFVTSPNNRAAMQTNANAAGVLYVSTEPLNTLNVLEANSISISSHVSGTVTYRSKTEIEFLPGFDSGSEYFDTEIVPALSSEYTFVQGYHDATFPSLKDYAHEVISLSYYDNYDFTTLAYDASLEVDFYTAGGTLNAVNPAHYANATGLATGSKVKVLGTADQWLTTAMFYDDRGRVIQTRGDNHLGGNDSNTTQYDFSGKVLNTYTTHTNPQASGSDAQTLIAKRFTYDQTGRLLTVAQKLNGSGSHKTITTNTYNALGELEEKTLGNSLETLEYNYNVRGWLEGINEGYVASGTGSHYFGMDLSYDFGFEKNQLNGNIAGVKWRSKSSEKQRAYGFEYDAVNRLKIADYNQKGGVETNWSKTESNFSTNYGYDDNGNILNLTRKGVVAGTIATIDQLTYAYTNSGKSNRLQYVSDDVNDLGQGDFTDMNEGMDDYDYDANGNMSQDKNKDIDAGDITYNHLNLPERIEFGNNANKTITYTYDAAGIKLRKTVNDNGLVTTTDYAGGFIYENNALQHFAHEEGRVRKSGGSLVYDYYIKDHLGNIRMTLTEATDITEYRATMETSQEVAEEQLFLNMDNSRYTYTDGNMTAGGEKVSYLNGAVANRIVGPGKILAVSPGDEVDMEVYAYYTGTLSNASPTDQGAMLTAVAAAFGGLSSSALGTESRSIYELFNTNAAATLVGGSATNPNEPKAYLNYLFFDQDFNFISSKSGFKQISSAAGDDAVPELLTKSLSIEQGGYVYVYISNETAASFEVYFDELEINHTKGAILQEDTFYPFGLNISALSSTAPLSKPNKFKFIGKERQTEFDMNWDDFGARTYDPQIGRFLQTDPLAYSFFSNSPYHYSYNNPLNFKDPDGRTIVDANGNEVGIEYEEDKKGREIVKFNFAEGTSKKVMRKFNNNAGYLIKEAVKSDIGKEVVKSAVDSDDNIHINYSTGTNRTKGGKLHLGVTKVVSTSTGWDKEKNMPTETVNNIDITVWGGSITEFSGLDTELLKGSMGKNIRQLWDDNNLTFGQKIGSVAIHELTHATTPSHLNKRRELTSTEHAIAYKNEEIAIKEYGKKNKN